MPGIGFLQKVFENMSEKILKTCRSLSALLCCRLAFKKWGAIGEHAEMLRGRSAGARVSDIQAVPWAQAEFTNITLMYAPILSLLIHLVYHVLFF